MDSFISTQPAPRFHAAPLLPVAWQRRRPCSPRHWQARSNPGHIVQYPWLLCRCKNNPAATVRTYRMPAAGFFVRIRSCVLQADIPYRLVIAQWNVLFHLKHDRINGIFIAEELNNPNSIGIFIAEELNNIISIGIFRAEELNNPNSNGIFIAE